jgi:protein gp37
MMGDKSKIEWTDATWNPLRGCSKISAGCQHCYAIREAIRHAGPGEPYEGLVTSDPPNWTGAVRFIPEKLAEPLRWLKPRMIFVNSMSDLFHEQVSWEAQAAILGVCLLAGQHTFQILTKRAELMHERLAELSAEECLEHAALFGVGLPPHKQRRQVAELMREMGRDPDAETWPPANVLIGPSIENQAAADERLPHATAIAGLGWRVMLSLEPLLGPVKLDLLRLDVGNPASCQCGHGHGFTRCPNTGGISKDCHVPGCQCNGFRRQPGSWRGTDWVIVGGESGVGARPMHPDWARSLRDQCQAAGVPFFFKQWGEWADTSHEREDDKARELCRIALDGTRGNFASLPTEKLTRALVMARVGKKAAGRLLDGREWNEFPAAVGPRMNTDWHGSEHRPAADAADQENS